MGQVAIKGYNLERLRLKHIVESLDSEIAIMKMFDHVNIVKLISVHRTSRSYLCHFRVPRR